MVNVRCCRDGDTGQITSRPVIVKQPYLVIQISIEDNIGGAGNLIQIATNSYFMKIFKFQCLLGQNCLSIETRKSVSVNSVDVSVESRSTEMIRSL